MVQEVVQDDIKHKRKRKCQTCEKLHLRHTIQNVIVLQFTDACSAYSKHKPIHHASPAYGVRLCYKDEGYPLCSTGHLPAVGEHMQ